tara:strand:- start:411 stop:668 length:258 start_codon:yes stop_codon:yes gene_type:complete
VGLDLHLALSYLEICQFLSFALLGLQSAHLVGAGSWIYSSHRGVLGLSLLYQGEEELVYPILIEVKVGVESVFHLPTEEAVLVAE